ncbi:MAG: IS3 family transposase [bacterium]
MTYWNQRAEYPVQKMLKSLQISSSKYYAWLKRGDTENRHNARMPKSGWLLEEEKQAIIAFHDQNLTEGYRRLAWIMNDKGIVAASPSSVRRVLQQAGRMKPREIHKSSKGNGFDQPLKPHQEWHTDISFIRIGGVFYSLCSYLDGFSRVIVHSELRETMKDRDVEVILQRAREKYPDAKPKIITDNGPQFISKDFKAFLSFCQMTQVRTSPYYPQSNGKIERWHKSLKVECIRPGVPLTKQHAERMITAYVEYYNNERLHSAIGYVPPMAKLEGRDVQIWEERKRKMMESRKKREQMSGEMESGNRPVVQAN